MRNELFNLTLLATPMPACQHRLQDRRTLFKEDQVWMGQCVTDAARHMVWGSLGTQVGRSQSRSWVCELHMPLLLPGTPAQLQPWLPACPQEHCGGRWRAGRKPEVNMWQNIWIGLLPRQGISAPLAQDTMVELYWHDSSLGQIPKSCPSPRLGAFLHVFDFMGARRTQP